jgi:ubiquinone/menaquinone biosynthesis C-methylase UbiE
MSTYLEKLLSTAALREATLKTAIESLELPKGSKGLDVGCGAGLQCVWLAEEIGADGHVTGLDVSTEFLEYGGKFANDAGLAERISFKEGSAEAIPFEDDSFDWVWSVDCVGYGPWEPMPLLKELKRVTKPGGTLVILAWSSERLLPGYPLLEAKLSATTPGLAPFSKDMDPARHLPRTLGLLRKLGLEAPRAKVFSGSAHAPLSDELYAALGELIEMRWPGAAEELSEDDRAEFKRLCEPDSPDFILDHPDYYAFFTYSMFYGTVSPHAQ